MSILCLRGGGPRGGGLEGRGAGIAADIVPMRQRSETSKAQRFEASHRPASLVALPISTRTCHRSSPCSWPAPVCHDQWQGASNETIPGKEKIDDKFVLIWVMTDGGRPRVPCRRLSPKGLPVFPPKFTFGLEEGHLSIEVDIAGTSWSQTGHLTQA
jgi:hypothetical protein